MEKVKAAVGGSGAPGSVPTPPRPPAFGAPAVAPAPFASPSPSGVSAPVPPPPAPAPVASADAPTDPTAALDELVRSVDGVTSALLASVDGFGLARSASMSDDASRPAMLAAAVGLAHQLAAMGGGSDLRQLVVEHDGGLLVVWPVGTQRVLAVVAASNVEQRQLRALVQRRLHVLNGATA